MKSSLSTIHWKKAPSECTLNDSELHIWLIKLISPEEKIKRYESYLSADEVERANRFSFVKDRIRFVVGRGSLREIISYYTKCLPQDLRFNYQHGKPFLESYNLSFNLTHSHDIALLAISRNQLVGIDVENIKRHIDFIKISKRYFATQEAKGLSYCDPEYLNETFYFIWTQKEAFVKAEGSGLSFSFKKFVVNSHLAKPAQLLEIMDQPEEEKKWEMYAFYPLSDYIASVVINMSSPMISFYRDE